MRILFVVMMALGAYVRAAPSGACGAYAGLPVPHPPFNQRAFDYWKDLRARARRNPNFKMPELRPTLDFFDRQVETSIEALEALLRSPAPSGFDRSRYNAQTLLDHLRELQRLSRETRGRGMRYQESLILLALGTQLFSWRFQLNPSFDLVRTLRHTRDQLVSGLQAVRRGEAPRLGASDLSWALRNTGNFFVLPIHYDMDGPAFLHLAGAPFRIAQIIPEPVTADGRQMDPGAFFLHDLSHGILGFRNMENEVGRSGLSVEAFFQRENELARAIEERLERVADDGLRRVLSDSLAVAFQDGGVSVRTAARLAGDGLTIHIAEELGGPANRRLARRARQWLQANVASLVGE